MEKFLEYSANRILAFQDGVRLFFKKHVHKSDTRKILFFTLISFFMFSFIILTSNPFEFGFWGIFIFVFMGVVLSVFSFIVISVKHRMKKQKLPFKFREVDKKKSKPEKLGLDEESFDLLCQLSMDREPSKKIEFSGLSYNEFFTMLSLMLFIDLSNRGKTKIQFLKFVRKYFTNKGKPLTTNNLKSSYLKWIGMDQNQRKKLEKDVKLYFSLNN